MVQTPLPYQPHGTQDGAEHGEAEKTTAPEQSDLFATTGPGPSGRREASLILQAEWHAYLLLVANRELETDLRPKVDLSELVQEALDEADRTLEPEAPTSRRELLTSLVSLLRKKLDEVRRLHAAAESGSFTLSSSSESDAGDQQGLDTSVFSNVQLAVSARERRCLHTAMRGLTPEQRTIIELRTFDSLSLTRAGVALGCSEKSVALQWSQAVLTLARYLAGVSDVTDPEDAGFAIVEAVPQELETDTIANAMLEFDETLARGDQPESKQSDLIKSLSPESGHWLTAAFDCLRLLHRERLDRTAVVQDATLTAESSMPLLERLQQLGRYHVLCELGRGGHAVVLLADDPVLQRLVAVKVPRIECSPTDEIARRFGREARAIAALNHPNIVEVLDVGCDGSSVYIVEAVCLGPTLKEWIEGHRGPAPSQLAARIVRDLSDAVHHAHSRNILHRDLKPANVLLEPLCCEDDSDYPVDDTKQLVAVAPDWFEGFPFAPRLTDFGIAKVFDDSVGETLTATNSVMGTAPYIAPEQAMGRNEDVGQPTDVYGLGVILYELLTGFRPFDGESHLAILRAVTETDPVPPRTHCRHVSADLEAVCLKCLEKDPRRRYSSAAELRQDLDRFLEGYPVRAQPVTVHRRFVRWCRRRPAQVISLALLLLLVIGASLAGWWHAVVLGEALTESQEQREFAETESLRADQASRRANHLRGLAEARTEELREHVFCLDAQVAHEALQRGDWGRCVQLLEKYQAHEQIRSGFVWRYLWRIAHLAASTWELGEGRVFTVEYSPDGQWFAAGTEDGGVWIWDADSREKRHQLEAHDACVNALCWTPDGKFVVTASCDRTVRLWDAESGQRQDFEFRSNVELYAVAVSPDGATGAIGDDKGTLYLLDMTSGNVIATTLVTSWRVESLAFSPDGTRLVAAAFNDAHLYSVPDLERLDSLHDQGRKVHAVAGSSDTSLFAWAGESRRLNLSSFSAGGTVSHGLDEEVDCRALSLNASATSVAVAGSSRVVRVQDLDSGELSHRFFGHRGRINGISVSPDESFVVTAGWDGMVNAWSMEDGGEWSPVGDFGGAAQAAFSDDGQLLIVTGTGFVRAFNVHDLTERYVLRGERFAIDADRLAVLHGGDVTMHRIQDGTRYGSAIEGWGPGHSGDLVFASDGKALVGSRGQGIESVALDESRHIRQVSSRTGVFVALAPIPGSDRVVISDSHQESFISVEPVLRDADPWELRGMTSSVSSVAADPDGRMVAGASTDDVIYVWDAESRAQMTSLIGHRSPTTCVAFSSDGRWLVSGDDDGDVHIWNLEAGHLSLVLHAHSRAVEAVAFSPDSGLLVTSSADRVKSSPDDDDDFGSVRLWRADVSAD